MPNPTAAMNARVGSACYPRGNFYPISSGPPMWPRRITKSCFRTCSTCLSCSQAPIYLYAYSTISIGAKGTLELLRYLLAGNRPSQTTNQALSSYRITVHSETCNKEKEVFHRCFLRSSLLHYIVFITHQCQVIVKLHGVFLSNSM